MSDHKLMIKSQVVGWLKDHNWDKLAEIVSNKPSYINMSAPHDGSMIEVNVLNQTIRQDIIEELKTQLTIYKYE
jgi:hypothetical protein